PSQAQPSHAAVLFFHARSPRSSTACVLLVAFSPLLGLRLPEGFGDVGVDLVWVVMWMWVGCGGAMGMGFGGFRCGDVVWVRVGSTIEGNELSNTGLLAVGVNKCEGSPILSDVILNPLANMQR
ncbi:hypothetical protein Ancab_005529, partial [Ancistrocladus abbreviatus]